MGYIKEPKGIDFIIQSDPLTDAERIEISNFIRKDKAKQLVEKKRGGAVKKAQPVKVIQ